MINAYGPTETTMYAAISAPLTAGVGGGADRVAGAGGGVVRAGRVVAAGAGRGGRRVVRGRRGRGVRVCAPGRADRVAVCGVPVRRARGADVSHRGSGALGCRWAAASIWVAPMSRSRSAGIASNSARCRRRWPGSTGCEQAVVIAREDRPGDKRLVGYVTGTADPAEVRAALAERLPGLHGSGRGGGDGGAAADGQRQTRHPRPAGTRVQRRRSVPRPGQRGRGDPGRHLRPGARARAGRGRRLVLRAGWRQHFVDAGGGAGAGRRADVSAARHLRRADRGPAGPGGRRGRRRGRRDRRGCRAGGRHPDHALAGRAWTARSISSTRRWWCRPRRGSPRPMWWWCCRPCWIGMPCCGCASTTTAPGVVADGARGGVGGRPRVPAHGGRVVRRGAGGGAVAVEPGRRGDAQRAVGGLHRPAGGDHSPPGRRRGVVANPVGGPQHRLGPAPRRAAGRVAGGRDVVCPVGVAAR